jgi:formyltetrahydrofolate synthetase
MEATEEALVRQLADHDQELRGLYEEHLALKRRLEDFRHKLYLTTEEELERKRIQKLKLASKDRMMAIVWRHQHHAQ